MKINRVLVALVVHVDDGGAVACDGLLLDTLWGGEARIGLRAGCGLRTGSAGLRLGLLVGIAVIVGIFLPVDHGVADRLLGGPRGGQLDVRIERVAEGERITAFRLPADEGVAGLGRVGGLRGLVSYELRRYVGAVGLEGDPKARLHLGVEVDVYVSERNGFDLGFGRIGRVRIPAGDGFVVIKGEGDVLKGDFAARHTVLGLNDIAVGRVEVDVVYFLEFCGELYGLALGDVALFTEFGELYARFIVPSDETMPFFLGRFRRLQLITVRDDLLFAVHFPIYVELVGEVLLVVRPDDLCRHRVGRQHVQRQ